MKEFKRNHYKFWYSPIALIILFVFCVLFLYNIIGLVAKEKETSHRKELTLDKVTELREKEKNLLEGISEIKTEEGREEIIREKYQVAKEGEKMVIIVDNSEDNSLDNYSNKGEHGFWNWFKGLFD